MRRKLCRTGSDPVTGMKLYQVLATLVDACHRCADTGNIEWRNRHGDELCRLCARYLPAGSGLDLGPRLDLGASTGEKLVFARCDFHHMHPETGMYDGWTEHTVTVRPSLQFGFRLSISGRNRNGIKDYIAEVFGEILNTEVVETE